MLETGTVELRVKQRRLANVKDIDWNVFFVVRFIVRSWGEIRCTRLENVLSQLASLVTST